MATPINYPLCDVVAVELKITGGTTHLFSTADEVGCEPVIEEGESLPLKIKQQIIAQKETPDVVLGHDITCKDNVFAPEVIADLQGGTVTKNQTEFSKYVAPGAGAITNAKVFDLSIYMEIVGEDGPTGEYLKYTFPKCKGSFIAPNFKDGEYYASEYTIKSRPALGEGLYSIDLVKTLPSGVQAFTHPALRALEEQEKEK